MNDVAKKFLTIAIPYLLGAGMAVAAMLVFDVAGLVAANKQLRIDIKQQAAAFGAASKSLADAQDANRQLAASNRRLQQELDGAGATVAEQQRSIEAAKQDLAELGRQITIGGGDIESRARAIAEGFDRLYSIYNPGPAGQ